MKKMIIAFVLFISCIIVFSSCSGTKTENSKKEKDELILAIGNEPEDGFDPTTGWGRYGSPLFHSTLFSIDDNFNMTNDLAVEHEVSADGLTWTVKIRDDVKFSDGQPLTAKDVLYTFETAKKSGSVVDLSILGSVEATDDHTIAFHLNDVQSTFGIILSNTGIVPKHAHGENYSEKPIGSGPYAFVQWDKGQQLIVEANPYYYGDKPYFKKLTFLYLTEDAAFAAAKSGQVDMASILPSFAKTKISGMELASVHSVDNRGILFPMSKSGGFTKDGIPIGNDVTSDIHIRRAINYAIDRQALVDGVLEGFGSPAYSICDNLPWWSPDNVIKDNDMKKAKEILSKGGWIDFNGDGIVEKDGLKAEFKLIYPSSDNTRQSLSISVADMLEPLGIKVTAQGKSWDEIELTLHSEPIMFGWGSQTPYEMYNLYSSKNAGIDYYNAGYYKNDQVDKYMELALKANNTDEANSYWQKSQWDGNTGTSVSGDAPWAWLVNINHLYLVNEHLDIGSPRIEPHGHGWPITANIAQWKWTN